MSDSIPVNDPIVSDKLARQREALAKGRAALAQKRADGTLKPRGRPARTAEVRTAEVRTAADVRAPSPVAAERAAPAREQSLPDEQFTRRRRDERTTGTFEVPERRKKRGWDYQWITIRVLAEPVDSARIRDFREGGWRPVLARDFPELVEEDAAPDSPIETEGQRLYCRPMSLTIEAKQEDLTYAQQQQKDRMMAAASGKSAVRGEEGIPSKGGVRPVPVSVEIEGLAG